MIGFYRSIDEISQEDEISDGNNDHNLDGCRENIDFERGVSLEIATMMRSLLYIYINI